VLETRLTCVSQFGLKWFGPLLPNHFKPSKNKGLLLLTLLKLKRVAMIVCIQIQSQRCLEMKLGKNDIVESSF